MPAFGATILGSWGVSGNTASSGTAFTRFVPPHNGGGRGGPPIYKVNPVTGELVGPNAITYINSILFSCGSTAHDVVVMRPLNWTYITEAVTANDTTIVMAADPGAYSTAYKYPLSGGATKPACVANNTIAGSDYVAFQLRDGTWHFSLVTSVSSLTLTLTTATPNVTGGGCDKYTPLYFFGAAGDSNPQTGAAHLYFSATASTRQSLLQDGAFVGALNAGDPLILYCANATAASTLIGATGFYADR